VQLSDRVSGRLLNDLEAMATAVPVLDRDELAILQEGIAVLSG
jgi:glucokinase